MYLLHALVEAEMGDLVDLLSLTKLSRLFRLVPHHKQELHIATCPAQVHHEGVYFAALEAVAGRVLHHHQLVLGRAQGFVELLHAVDLVANYGT